MYVDTADSKQLESIHNMPTAYWSSLTKTHSQMMYLALISTTTGGVPLYQCSYIKDL